MAFLWYFVARDSTVREKLVGELMPWFGKTVPDEFASADLAKCAYLEAVIKESMRVISPSGHNLGRSTPPGGITVDGVYIPGNVVVRIGSHVFHRSKPAHALQLQCFEIPELTTLHKMSGTSSMLTSSSRRGGLHDQN
jgi:tryprostatin B 6-hydroxylase